MIERLHDHLVRGCLAQSFVCLVKHDETYILTEIDVSIGERIEKDLGRRDYDLVGP